MVVVLWLGWVEIGLDNSTLLESIKADGIMAEWSEHEDKLVDFLIPNKPNSGASSGASP